MKSCSVYYEVWLSDMITTIVKENGRITLDLIQFALGEVGCFGENEFVNNSEVLVIHKTILVLLLCIDFYFMAVVC